MSDQKYLSYFENIFEIYENIYFYKDSLNIDDYFNDFVKKHKSWISRLKSPEFKVAFIGMFSSGKSVIVNALLGKYILPEDPNPYTAIPTIVKKASSDYAKVYFLDENKKIELKNLYIEKILDEIKRNDKIIFEKLKSLNTNDLLSEIRILIGEAEENNIKNPKKEFDELNKLIREWNRYNCEVKDITHEEIKEYVAELNKDGSKNEKILFIDKIEVFIQDSLLPNDVVLVDLPGIGVANPRHAEITKKYVTEKSKAFVFAMKPMDSISGDANTRLLTNIQEERPDVLKNAFWVFNQWDVAGEDQRNKILEGFKNTFNIQVSENRKYKVSALLYLIKTLLEKDDVSQSFIKSKIDILKKELTLPQTSELSEVKIAIKEQEFDKKDYILEFERFTKELLDYLSGKAKKDFEEEARKALESLCQKILSLGKFNGEYQNFKAGDRHSKAYRELPSQLEQYVYGLKNLTKNEIFELKNEISSFDFWKETTENEIMKEIDERTKKIDRKKLKINLQNGEGIDNLKVLLPGLIRDEIDIYKMVQSKFIGISKEKFFDDFFNRLKQNLKNLNKQFLPDSLNNYIDSELEFRFLEMRLKGIADILLIDYGNELDKSLLALVPVNNNTNNNMGQNPQPVQTTSNELDKYIEQSINKFTLQMKDFVRKLKPNVNNYTQRALKNYLESLKDDFLKKIDELKNYDISYQISRSLFNESNEQYEVKRTNAIIESYEKIEKIYKSIK